MAFAKNMKLIKAVILLCVFSGLSCKKERPAVDDKVKATKIDLNELCDKINMSGGEAIADKGVVNEVHIIHTPDKCIPYINKLTSVEDFYLSYYSKTLSNEDFEALRVFQEVKILTVLYGTLTAKSFSKLNKKFPNIQELVLWGNLDSDITELPALEKLQSFTSDSDHLMTVPEAKRLMLSKNLVEVTVDYAESREVYNILKTLPKIVRLSVGVYKDDERIYYTLP